MLTTEVIATVDHPYMVAFAPALDNAATVLAQIAADIDSADDSDAPTFAASLAKFTKAEPEKAAAYDEMVRNVKAAREAIYFAVNGHAEKDSDRTVLIDSAKATYYEARRMATLIELSCDAPGFVNLYLGSLTIPEGSGLRKSVKVVK